MINGIPPPGKREGTRKQRRRRRPRSIAGMAAAAAVGLAVFRRVVVALRSPPLSPSLYMLYSDYAVVFPPNMPSSVIHPDELPSLSLLHKQLLYSSFPSRGRGNCEGE